MKRIWRQAVKRLDFSVGISASIEWDWPQGVGLYGLLKIMKIKKNKEYTDFLYHWFEDNIRQGLPSKNIKYNHSASDSGRV